MKARCQSISIYSNKSGAYASDLKPLFGDFEIKIRMNAIYPNRSKSYAVQYALFGEGSRAGAKQLWP
jgi:hypothetical protein